MKRSVLKPLHTKVTGDLPRMMRVSLPCEPWEKPDEPEPDPPPEPKEKIAGTDQDKRRQRRSARHLGPYTRHRKDNGPSAP